MKNIVILGSTGSIGQNALEVIRNFPSKFRVLGLSAHSNTQLLEKQIKEFKPAFVCIGDLKAARNLKSRVNRSVKVLPGDEGILQGLDDRSIDKVLLSISGSGALAPLLKAIENNLDVALANKEALVMAGPIIMRRAAIKKIKVLPIDSEQSAIWQCLESEDRDSLKNIYLTASGGPFRNYSPEMLKKITVTQALKHPRWKMGKKITVDSATLLNKGLELLEAMYLFGVGPNKIKIVIHPEAIIHSMVEFVDGVIMAQLSITDMRIPIQYALTYPERLPSRTEKLDFFKLKSLNFEKADFNKFPCLEMAYQAAREGGTLPCVMNAANEVAVEKFLAQRLKFTGIPEVIAKVMRRHKKVSSPKLEDIFGADEWAKNEAGRIINS